MVKQACLWGVCVLLCEDLHYQPRRDIVNTTIREILVACTNANTEISQAALDVLCVLSGMYERLCVMDQTTVTTILNTLCDNIIALITKTKVITQNQQVFGR